jgi:hypothetical protein
VPYRHPFTGLTNRSLRELVAGLIPGYTARQMTNDLRQLRRQGLIRRAPRQPTLRAGRPRPADRRPLHEDLHPIINPSLAELDPALSDEITKRSPVARARRAFEQALNARIADAQLTG